MCSSWKGFVWHSASRGPSVIAERLVHINVHMNSRVLGAISSAVALELDRWKNPHEKFTFNLNCKTKLASVALCCKGQNFKTANIKFYAKRNAQTIAITFVPISDLLIISAKAISSVLRVSCFFLVLLSLFCSCVVCFCCVRFISFVSTKPRDWLGKTSPKRRVYWPGNDLCWTDSNGNKKASIRWQDSARRQFQAGLRGDVEL